MYTPMCLATAIPTINAKDIFCLQETQDMYVFGMGYATAVCSQLPMMQGVNFLFIFTLE